MDNVVIIDNIGNTHTGHDFYASFSIDKGLQFKDVAAYVARNMGFVSMQMMRDAVLVSFRPKIASSVAVMAAAYWMADQDPQRIIVRDTDASIPDKMFTHSGAAIKAMMHAMQTASTKGHGRFHSSKIPVDQFQNDAVLAKCWSARKRMSNIQSINDAEQSLRSTGCDTYAVIQVRPSSGRMIVERIGAGYSVLEKRWLKHAINNRVQDQVDYDYGCWIAGTYKDVFDTDVPAAEKVVATVRKLKGTMVHATYARLVMPARTKSGERLILSASTVQSLKSVATDVK